MYLCMKNTCYVVAYFCLLFNVLATFRTMYVVIQLAIASTTTAINYTLNKWFVEYVVSPKDFYKKCII